MEEVLDFIRKLNASPIVGDCMPPEKKAELLSDPKAQETLLFFTAENIWNILSEADRDDFVGGKVNARILANYFSERSQIVTILFN
jgi:hypothetical protein